MSKRILVAGIGNIFFGDDAFGVEVARRLKLLPLPQGVEVVDFGIRGIDLAFAMLEGRDAVILVDAMRGGGSPGALHLIEPVADDDANVNETAIETHEMTPAKILRAVRKLGGAPGRVLVFGCEPENLGTPEEPVMGLSSVVEDAVDRTVSLVQALVAELASSLQPLGEQP